LDELFLSMALPQLRLAIEHKKNKLIVKRRFTRYTVGHAIRTAKTEALTRSNAD
jgi:hypothetical protein